MQDGANGKQTRTWLDYFAFLAFRSLMCLIQSTDLQRTERICRLMAFVLAKPLKLRRRLIHDNLKRVFPHWPTAAIEQTEERMWFHLLLMVCEIAHAKRKIHRTNWYQHFRIPNRGEILRHVFDSRAKLLVTGHLGNFELAGFVNGVFGLPSTTIARELDNGFLHDYITNFRSTGGQHFLSKNSGAEPVQELLNNGGTLALLADQDAGVRGVWVDFLGHPASCHKALALFTLSSGAPTMVVSNRRLNAPLQFELQWIDRIDPENEADDRLAGVEAITNWYNRCLETSIRKYPDQYWWVHRRWREPPARLRKKAKQVAA